MFWRCIVVFTVIIFAGLGAASNAFAQTEGDISAQKIEAILAASAELDAFFAKQNRLLERARPEQIAPLQEQLITEPKAILARHNLTSQDLATYRQKLEAHGDLPQQAIEDPNFHLVVKRLLPKQ